MMQTPQALHWLLRILTQPQLLLRHLLALKATFSSGNVGNTPRVQVDVPVDEAGVIHSANVRDASNDQLGGTPSDDVVGNPGGDVGVEPNGEVRDHPSDAAEVALSGDVGKGPQSNMGGGPPAVTEATSSGGHDMPSGVRVAIPGEEGAHAADVAVEQQESGMC